MKQTTNNDEQTPEQSNKQNEEAREEIDVLKRSFLSFSHLKRIRNIRRRLCF